MEGLRWATDIPEAITLVGGPLDGRLVNPARLRARILAPGPEGAPLTEAGSYERVGHHFAFWHEAMPSEQVHLAQYVSAELDEELFEVAAKDLCEEFKRQHPDLADRVLMDIHHFAYPFGPEPDPNYQRLVAFAYR